MKKKIRFIPIVAILAALVFYGGIGCGNVCDDAADICGAGSSEGGGSGGGGSGESGADVEGECSGAAECTAQCIVDADSCDVTDPDLADCITGCAGG